MALLLAGGGYFLYYQALQKRIEVRKEALAKIKKELAAHMPKAKALDRMKKQRHLLAQTVAVAGESHKARMLKAQQLAEIIHLLHDRDIQLIRVNITSGAVAMEGHSADGAGFNRYAADLDRSRLFDEYRFEAPEITLGDLKPRLSFKLKAAIPPKPTKKMKKKKKR